MLEHFANTNNWLCHRNCAEIFENLSKVEKWDRRFWQCGTTTSTQCALKKHSYIALHNQPTSPVWQKSMAKRLRLNKYHRYQFTTVGTTSVACRLARLRLVQHRLITKPTLCKLALHKPTSHKTATRWELCPPEWTGIRGSESIRRYCYFTMLHSFTEACPHVGMSQ